MKILMTGATSLQVRPTEKRRSAVTKIDVPGAVVDVLREAGHTVDWRATTPGEDLSSYDLLWICVAGVNSVNATPGAIGMLWAMQHTSVPAVVFLDDWKTRLTYQQARNFARNAEDNIYYDRHLLSGIRNFVADGNPTHYTYESALKEYGRCCAGMGASGRDIKDLPKPTPFYQQRADFTAEEWAELKAPVVHGARLMLEGRPNSVISIPAYRWGSSDVVRPTLPPAIRDVELHRLDPSFIAVDILREAVADSTLVHRRDAWGLAALGDHTEWLEKYLPDRTWPVEAVGHKSNRKLKTEHDVVRFYNECAAILSPSYYHAGSGWWRSRFIYAAGLMLPIYAADGEASPLGDAYDISPKEIENTTFEERVDLARRQQQALWPQLSGRDEFKARVEEIIGAVA